MMLSFFNKFDFLLIKTLAQQQMQRNYFALGTQKRARESTEFGVFVFVSLDCNWMCS